MSDELRAAKAGAGDTTGPVEEEASVPTPPAVSKEGAETGPTSRRPKARMSLRIPDDEVSRPRSAPPTAVVSAPPAAAGPIAPGRIITINPPSSSVPAEALPSARLAPTAPRVPSVPVVSTAPLAAPVAPPRVVSGPPAAPAAPALPPPPHAPAVADADLDADKTQPRAAVAASLPEAPDTDMIPVTSSEPPVSSPRLASSEAVGAEELDEAESAAMLAESPPLDDESLDIPVEEGEEEPAPSSDPEMSAEDLVVSVEPAKVEPRHADASSGPSTSRSNPPAQEPAASRSFPPPAMHVGMSSTPDVAVAARAEAAAAQPVAAARVAPSATGPRGASQSSPLAPPPMNESAAARKRVRPWWEELFNDDFLRTMAKVTDPQISGECDFIEESLGVAKGAMVLDLACGTGRHAIELTRRGYQVVGFDLSLPMLAKAADEAQERDQKINFVQGDMRDMTFEETFDGIYSWNTSFGFFEEEKNAQVISRVHKALRLGGQFLLEVANRDYVIKQSPSLCWFEGDGCICMDEMQVDFITSRMRVKRTMMMDDGRSKEIEYSIRIYSLHELGKILHDHGFRVVEVSGRMATPGVFFGNEAPRTLILAEKR